MLPSLSQLHINAGKRRREYPPCPDELFYKDGEIVNIDRSARVRGQSSPFHGQELAIIPLEPPFPSSWEDFVPMYDHGDTENSLHTVLTELYRNDGFDANEKLKSYDDEALKRAFNNKHQSQYYLQTLRKPTVVTHIISNGRFGGYFEDDEHEQIRVEKGKLAYTYGFLWCNTSPDWSWKTDTRSKAAMRCRIEIPENTQVVVDRSPVYGARDHCQFDEHRTSFFPDVLLPPGEFFIDSVKRYRAEDADESNDEDDVEIETMKRNLARVHLRPNRGVLSDEEYAARMLRDVDNFVDVRLKVTRMMRLPEKI